MSTKKYTTGELIRRLLPYFSPYKKTLVIDLFCASLTTLCEIVLPMIIRHMTNTALADIAQLTRQTVLSLGFLYFALRIIDSTANYYMANTGHVMGAKIETDMRRDAYGHLQKLSDTYYNNTKVGQIMGRITNDLFDITEFSHHCPEEFFIAGIKIIVSFIILSFMNIPLTLIMFAVIPLMALCLRYFKHRMKESMRESRVTLGELNAQIEDSLLGVRVVKSFANEGIEQEKFKGGNERFLKIKSVMYKYMGSYSSINRTFEGIMYIVVAVIGAFFLVAEKIEASDYVAYLMYASMLLTAIRKLVDFVEQFQRGMTGIERFSEILDIQPDIVDEKGADELKAVKGEIAFKNVSFKYKEDAEKYNCKAYLASATEIFTKLSNI